MESFSLPASSKETILALGAESAGNFSAFRDGTLHFSEDFGDLLDDTNFRKYQRALREFLKREKITPTIILTDLHPLFKTTALGEELARKYKARHIPIQHHLAHIFSAVADEVIQSPKKLMKLKARSFIGIALDGTGYGTDGKIWGGEIFKISNLKSQISKIDRVGHLENQVMIGGELAIKEPARMLISILNQFLGKNEVYSFVKKYYSKNQFEVLYSQLQQNFNCIETSSMARVLDAVSLLLGFCGNERKYKHEPAQLLEHNSNQPYKDIKPKIDCITNKESEIRNQELNTTYLFEYLIKNLHRDKKRLAATAQLYIAQGLYETIGVANQESEIKNQKIYLSGGIANNKIISSHLESKEVYVSKKIPRGDAGISVGQIVYILSAK